MHLLIPFAASHTDAAHSALAPLRLPQLDALLARLTPTHTDTGLETSLSPPHERALARDLGLALQDGLIPWGAWQARALALPGADDDSAWAWITLCHWQARSGRISMHDARTLGVTSAQSQTLLQAMRRYFEEDGITLAEHSPGRWLARGEPLRGVACASLDRVSGRRIDTWMPTGAQARTLLRLQNEMQMLLYTHSVNDERAEQGCAPINSFWVSGAGALPSGLGVDAGGDLVMPQTLRDAAVAEDWAAWSQAWAALDAGPVAQALQQLQQGLGVRLTLCGERNARRFEVQPQGLMRRLTQLFVRPSAQSVLETL